IGVNRKLPSRVMNFGDQFVQVLLGTRRRNPEISGSVRVFFTQPAGSARKRIPVKYFDRADAQSIVSESGPQPYIIRLFEILLAEHRIHPNGIPRVTRRLIEPECVRRTAGNADTREAFGRKEREPTDDALDLFVKWGDREGRVTFSDQAHGGFTHYSIRSAAFFPIECAARRILGLKSDGCVPERE